MASNRSTQRCVFYCATYTDVGMALNLNSAGSLFKKKTFPQQTLDALPTNDAW
jgi:hypothetical protein